MAEALTLIAIGLLIVFMLLRAYATRILTELHRQAQKQITEERQARQAQEREETVLESLEARIGQLHDDRARHERELTELDAEIARVEAEVRRARGGDEDDAARDTPAPADTDQGGASAAPGPPGAPRSARRPPPPSGPRMAGPPPPE